MKNLVVLGAGKIGRIVTHLLATCGDYSVRVGDVAQGAVENLSKKHPQVKGQVGDFASTRSLDDLRQGAFGVIHVLTNRPSPRAPG